MPNSVKFNPDYPDITKSDALYERALKVQKPITQTLAKGPGQFTKGVAPKYIQKAKGSHVWDVDGNEYIDYNSAIGPISLGYCYPAVDDAIVNLLFATVLGPNARDRSDHGLISDAIAGVRTEPRRLFVRSITGDCRP